MAKSANLFLMAKDGAQGTIKLPATQETLPWKCSACSAEDLLTVLNCRSEQHRLQGEIA